MRGPGCGRSARPNCAPEGGTLAGQGANDADQVAFWVLEPCPLASIRRPSNDFFRPGSRFPTSPEPPWHCLDRGHRGAMFGLAAARRGRGRLSTTRYCAPRGR